MLKNYLETKEVIEQMVAIFIQFNCLELFSKNS